MRPHPQPANNRIEDRSHLGDVFERGAEEVLVEVYSDAAISDDATTREAIQELRNPELERCFERAFQELGGPGSTAQVDVVTGTTPGITESLVFEIRVTGPGLQRRLDLSFLRKVGVFALVSYAANLDGYDTVEQRRLVGVVAGRM